MNFGQSGPDREATMADGVRKRAMLRQEQVIKQAEAAERPTTRSTNKGKKTTKKVDTKPPPIRPGDTYMYKGKKYTVKSVAKSGRSVQPVNGPKASRRDVYKYRISYAL